MLRVLFYSIPAMCHQTKHFFAYYTIKKGGQVCNALLNSKYRVDLDIE